MLRKKIGIPLAHRNSVLDTMNNHEDPRRPSPSPSATYCRHRRSSVYTFHLLPAKQCPAPKAVSGIKILSFTPSQIDMNIRSDQRSACVQQTLSMRGRS